MLILVFRDQIIKSLINHRQASTMMNRYWPSKIINSQSLRAGGIRQTSNYNSSHWRLSDVWNELRSCAAAKKLTRAFHNQLTKSKSSWCRRRWRPSQSKSKPTQGLSRIKGDKGLSRNGWVLRLIIQWQHLAPMTSSQAMNKAVPRKFRPGL